jgi:dihydrofolate synthase/folylpolyglutamate synthase
MRQGPFADTYQAAEEYLFSKRRMGMKYGLERIRELLEELGNPQESFRTVHVVGTNGKGSTAMIMAEVGAKLGLRTGLLTSPHLLSFRERISVDGRWIPRRAVCSFVADHGAALERISATFFEICTAMAADHFRCNGVDWVVAEAGLGGRLDATRTLDGEATVFTGVALEHTRILGPTRSAIAAEKLAIAGTGSTIIASEQTEDVEEVLSEALDNRRLRRVFPVPAPTVAAPGSHQKLNAALAYTACLELFGASENVLKKAFRDTCGEIYLPGRLDWMEGDPPILFDVAHNPESMAGMVENVRERELPLPAVIGFLADKRCEEMLDVVKGTLEPVVVTTPISERAMSAADLAQLVRNRLGIECAWSDSVPESVDLGRKLASRLQKPLVVTGSFFLTGEAMRHCWRMGWVPRPEHPDIAGLT